MRSGAERIAKIGSRVPRRVESVAVSVPAVVEPREFSARYNMGIGLQFLRARRSGLLLILILLQIDRSSCVMCVNDLCLLGPIRNLI